MDALTLTTACILCAAQPAQTPNVARWEPIIAEASARFGIPETWIEGVMHAESDGLTMLNGKPITSSVGAMGLMQIMPNTYAALRKQYRLGADPYDPHDNILAGAAYLKAMYARYGYPLLFAAYLTGPARLDQYLSSSERLPQTVIAYVNSIAPGAISDANPGSWQPDSSAQTAKNPRASGLFFALRSSPKAPSSGKETQPKTPTKPALSVFVDAVRPADLFASPSPHEH